MTFSDTIPAGFQIPAGGINLHVTDGTGTPLAFVDLGGGLFGAGLRLVDPSATSGALARFDLASGKNIAIITYDLELSPTVGVNSTLVNTATLSHYASVPNGPDFLPVDLTDPASVSTKGVSINKALTATDQAFTTGASELAIGEIGTYTVTITVPQGLTSAARLVDTLPDGLAIVNLVSLTTSSPGLLTFSNGSLASILATAQASGIGANGSTATFDFGDIQDNDTDPANLNTITVVYRVVALNVSANTNNRPQSNSARFFYNNTSTVASTTAKIVVPQMQVDKTVDNPTADANDVVTYTVRIGHTGNSGTDAFNLKLSDLVPDGVTYVPGSLTYIPTGGSNSLAPTTLAFDAVGNLIRATYDSFARNQVSVLTFQAVVDSDIQAFRTVTNTARIEYTSLPGSPQASSPYNPNSVERTGNPTDPGGSANNLNASDPASFTPTPTITKVLVGTNQAFTSGNAVAIGETAQYRVTIEIPEGVSPAAVFADHLPDGLALVSLDQFIASPALTTSLGSFANVLQDAVVENLGRQFTLDLGSVTNPVVNGPAQTITIVYTTIVTNVQTNQSGTTLTNDATFQSGSDFVEISAAPLIVVTPRLNITKTASPTVGDSNGAPITFTIIIGHDATSTVDAFDLTIIDPLLLRLNYVPGSLVYVAGQVPTTLQINGPSVTATYDQLPLGATSTIQFQATLSPLTVPGQSVPNAAAVFYTTLPGSEITPISPYNPVSTERTGRPANPGGATNDLAASDFVEVEVLSNSLTGTVFADLNNDGLFNGADTPLAGVVLTLTGTDNLGDAVNLTTTTDAAGLYAFTNLRPGDYVITETQPNGYLSGINTIGSQGGTAAPPPGNVLSAIILPVGVSTDGTGNNFAELLPSALAGTVYVDANENGIQEQDEQGIPDVTITLTGTDDLGPVTLTTTTSATGTYSFKNLRPGTYTITETQPNGFVNTINTIGTQSGTVAPGDVLTNILLGQDVDGTGNNFGERFSSSLAGIVFVDLNNDGIFNGASSSMKGAGLALALSELGLPGVTVTLTGVDNLGNPVLRVTTTATDGTYHFEGLRAGTYLIRETQPPGYLSGINTIGTQGGTAAPPPGNVLSAIILPVGVSTDGTGNNFAELLPSALAGTVYVDANENGIQEAGEGGIPGVIITLTGTDDLEPVTLTTTTSATGTYSFENLRPGTYTITETQPKGFVNTINTIGTQGGTVAPGDVLTNILLGQDVDGAGNNFGERFSSSMSGKVFLDINNDGILNGADTPLGGVIITLTGTDNLGNSVTRTTTTNAAGVYSFTELRAGSYIITETQPANYVSGINTIGSQGGVASPAPENILSAIVLPVGVSTNGVGNDFAELLASSLAGTVFEDLDQNGIQGAGEAGIPGVTITLTGVDDLGQSVLLVTTTRADGRYRFDVLRSGTYTITETQPPGYLSGINTIGTQGGFAALPPSDVLSSIILPPGVSTNGVENNFAEIVPTKLSGCVYWDVNHSGRMDSPDFGIAGVTITLTGTDSLGNSIHQVTTTAADGTYQFTALRPGIYTITETQPALFRDYKDNLGSLGGIKTNDKFSSIVVKPGDQGLNYCFGELQKPGCSLRHLAVAIGNHVAQDLSRRARNPAAFDARSPQVGASLAQGKVPRGVGRYPRGPLAYANVPLLGTKKLVRFANPATGQVDLRGVPNFTQDLTTRQLPRQRGRIRPAFLLK